MNEPVSKSHIKLVSTPTSGLPGEHSPYYRRLLSAGYKGFLQGNLGGATLYGTIGAAVGLIAAGPLFLLGVPGALAVIPILAAYGTMKGFDTFGSIGSHAAIQAEAAEINERRRALHDRLQETDSVDEAVEIKRMLQSENKETPPKAFLHWKTVLFGALIGAALLAGLAMAANVGLFGSGIAGILAHIAPAATTAAAPVTTTAGIAASIGGILGAAIGSAAGIDRFYIRRWFDVFEHILHDRDNYQEIARTRLQETNNLQTIANNERERVVERDRLIIEKNTVTPAEEKSPPIISTDKALNQPRNKVSEPEAATRLQEYLMQAPAV
jgi:hypothetical protein